MHAPVGEEQTPVGLGDSGGSGDPSCCTCPVRHTGHTGPVCARCGSATTWIQFLRRSLEKTYKYKSYIPGSSNYAKVQHFWLICMDEKAEMLHRWKILA